MTKTTTATPFSLDCCPLCQHEEYLISQDGEKFICQQCGFKTEHLKSIQLLLTTQHNALAPHHLGPTVH